MGYVKQRESMSSVPLIASLLVHIVASVYSSFILPSSAIHFLVILAPIILTVPIVWISIAESFPMVCNFVFFFSSNCCCLKFLFLCNNAKSPPFKWPNFSPAPFQYFSETIVNASKRFNDIHFLRRTAAILTIAIVGCTNLFDMFMCASTIDHMPSNDSLYNAINVSAQKVSTTLSPNQIISGLQNDHKSSAYFASTICTQFPSYFSNYAILILVATSVVVQLTHVCKFILMLIIAGK